MPIKVGKGRSEVTISGVLADDLEAEIRDLLGPVVDEIQREADDILAREIKPNWPEKSGKSLDSWRTFLRVHPDSMLVEVVLSSDVKYTRFIRSTRKGWRADVVRMRVPLTEHVRKPATKARRRLRKSLPDIIARAISDGILS